ncbi:MAG: hybrid sensor histidine kinase/response regulator [Gammaproteobacteria bacterium]|nr:hybrid sensor histidine kinase/response regulator [Gammaproteobacteria bacterium]
MRNKPITPNTRYLYALSSAIAGAVWGSTILVFKPTSLGEFLPIALTLASVMAGGISVLSYVWVSYIAFILPMTVLFFISFFFIDHQIAVPIGFMVLIYVIACLYFSRSFSKVLTENLRLRHENDVLLNDLRIKKEIAEQANRSKSQFLAAASHDLRQPLHALSMLFEAVKETNSNDIRISLYPKIETSIHALSNLFNSLLDISKLDAGVVEAKAENIEIKKIILSNLNQYETETKKKNLSIRVHCNGAIVYTDHVFIERILRNLISNAIRYTETGGILVSCRNRGNFVLLQVWDTGIGIAENEIENVYAEFYQLHNPQRDRQQGLGLGLSIVRRLCDLLDCSLELRSKPGSGTVVSILLPKGDARNIQKTVEPEPLKQWQLAGLRVLIIDDDLEVLTATSILLKKWGCVVMTAKTSDEVLENIDFSEQADFILSDLRLPGELNGIELLDLIRARAGKDIPAIIITGDTGPERILLSQKSSYKILHKPLKPAQLRTTIHIALTNKTVS